MLDWDWTNTYSDVLVDPQNCFAAAMDKLSWKKLSNNGLFEHMQKGFISKMEIEDLQTRTAEHFKGCPKKLDTSTDKLQQNSNWFKMEWLNKTDHVKMVRGFIWTKSLIDTTL